MFADGFSWTIFSWVECLVNKTEEKISLCCCCCVCWMRNKNKRNDKWWWHHGEITSYSKWQRQKAYATENVNIKISVTEKKQQQQITLNENMDRNICWFFVFIFCLFAEPPVAETAHVMNRTKWLNVLFYLGRSFFCSSHQWTPAFRAKTSIQSGKYNNNVVESKETSLRPESEVETKKHYARKRKSGNNNGTHNEEENEPREREREKKMPVLTKTDSTMENTNALFAQFELFPIHL